MKIEFVKYEGTGNDFVLLDNRQGLYKNLMPEQITFLCHRRFGVGADGLMLLQPHPELAFAMTYYNSDGFEASMCGNGARCICAFAVHLGIVPEETPFQFLAADGPHHAIYHKGHARLKMIDVPTWQQIDQNWFLNTGVPHLVIPVADMAAVDVSGTGREWRYHARFQPEGTNVNFMQMDGARLTIRTYERGVEDETYSCGTGVVASAIAASLLAGASSFEVEVKGGHLRVALEHGVTGFQHIWLSGPATRVFEGTLHLKH